MTLKVNGQIPPPPPPPIEVTLVLNGQEAADLMNIVGQIYLRSTHRSSEITVHSEIWSKMKAAGIQPSKDFNPKI